MSYIFHWFGNKIHGIYILWLLYGLISSCGVGSKQGKLSILSTDQSDHAASLHSALQAICCRPRYLTLGSLCDRGSCCQGFLEVQYIFCGFARPIPVFGGRKKPKFVFNCLFIYGSATRIHIEFPRVKTIIRTRKFSAKIKTNMADYRVKKIVFWPRKMLIYR
jgi:hypothetical protein